MSRLSSNTHPKGVTDKPPLMEWKYGLNCFNFAKSLSCINLKLGANCLSLKVASARHSSPNTRLNFLRYSGLFFSRPKRKICVTGFSIIGVWSSLSLVVLSVWVPIGVKIFMGDIIIAFLFCAVFLYRSIKALGWDLFRVVTKKLQSEFS